MLLFCLRIYMTLIEALKLTKEEFIQIYGEELQDFRLEEIGNRNDFDYWHLTVSFLLPEKNPLKGMALDGFTGGKEYERIYKEVNIKKAEKNLESMKIFNQ